MSSEEQIYTQYYLHQAGGGIANVFRGSYGQAGHGRSRYDSPQFGCGIGSWLSGLWKMAIPLFKSGAKAVGKEFLKGTANVIGDVIAKKPLKESLKTRLGESAFALGDKAAVKIKEMTGSGSYKKLMISGVGHSLGESGRRRAVHKPLGVKKTKGKIKKKISKNKKKKKTKKKVKTTQKKRKQTLSAVRDIFA